MPTPKQTKLIMLLKDNMTSVDSTATLGELLLKAGYTKTTAKNAYLIFESKAIKRATQDIAKALSKKRDMAITHLTDKKLRDAPARELIYAVDVLTKNIQLISGRSTGNLGVSIQISEALASKYMTKEELSETGLQKLEGGGYVLN